MLPTQWDHGQGDEEKGEKEKGEVKEERGEGCRERNREMGQRWKGKERGRGGGRGKGNQRGLGAKGKSIRYT